MPGYPVDRSQVDNLAGTISRQIDTWAPDALKMQQYLSALTDEELQAPPFSYSADDVARLKSAFNDLSKLANVYLGQDTVAEAYDFGTFSRRLAGLYL